EPPDEERFNRAEQDLAIAGASCQRRVAFEEIRDFGPREIRIEQQPGFLSYQRLGALRFQPLANRRAHAALPNDGISDWLACLALPQNSRLALIGDADRGNVVRCDPGALNCLLCCTQL